MTAECLVGWNVVCQPGYMAEEAIAVATDGLGDGRETSGRGNLHIPAELVPKCTKSLNGNASSVALHAP